MSSTQPYGQAGTHGVPVTIFHKFPDLPTEIRQRIWEEATKQPRILQLSKWDRHSYNVIFRNGAWPAQDTVKYLPTHHAINRGLYEACKESYLVARRVYIGLCHEVPIRQSAESTVTSWNSRTRVNTVLDSILITEIGDWCAYYHGLGVMDLAGVELIFAPLPEHVGLIHSALQRHHVPSDEALRQPVFADDDDEGSREALVRYFQDNAIIPRSITIFMPDFKTSYFGLPSSVDGWPFETLFQRFVGIVGKMVWYKGRLSLIKAANLPRSGGLADRVPPLICIYDSKEEADMKRSRDKAVSQRIDYDGSGRLTLCRFSVDLRDD